MDPEIDANLKGGMFFCSLSKVSREKAVHCTRTFLVIMSGCPPPTSNFSLAYVIGVGGGVGGGGWMKCYKLQENLCLIFLGLDCVFFKPIFPEQAKDFSSLI